MKFDYSFDFDSDIEHVFSYLETPEKQKLWIYGATDIVSTSEAEESFIIKAKGSKAKDYKVCVLSNQKPTHRHIKTEDDNFVMDIIYDLRKVTDNTTKLEYECTIIPKKTTFRFWITVLSPIANMIVKQQLIKLKKLVEAENNS